ncbi:MAG: hypothetical protein AB2541_11570 [Candidatus Thiodiazotropha sp.]
MASLYAGSDNPQDDKGNLAVFLVVTRVVKVEELRFGRQVVKVLPGDRKVLADCSVDIPKGLDGVPLAAEVLINPVKTLCALSRPFCLGGLQLFDCLS